MKLNGCVMRLEIEREALKKEKDRGSTATRTRLAGAGVTQAQSNLSASIARYKFVNAGEIIAISRITGSCPSTDEAVAALNREEPASAGSRREQFLKRTRRTKGHCAMRNKSM
jgi:hypothetical protein